MPTLLNYITSPDVLIWSAVMASCALPGIFKSAPLYAKDVNGGYKHWHHVDNKWIDGSVENDIPLKKLSEMFNVNHFIVSQVNPHIYPFLLMTPIAKACGSLYEKIFILLMTEAKFRVGQLSKTGIFRKGFRMLQNILEQPYQGDINIVPRLALKDLFNFYTDPDFESVNRALISGQKAAWPSSTTPVFLYFTFLELSRAQMQCRVELTLDSLLCRLRERLSEIVGSSNNDIQEIFYPEQSRSVDAAFRSRESVLLEGIENIIGETTSITSIGDSILFQEAELQPIEFVKPFRSASVTYPLDYTPTDDITYY
jgi:hypothetical protein